MRHNTDDPRYGLARSASAASCRGGRGGSITATAHTGPDTAHTTAGNKSAADTPWLSARRGITKAPNPTPSGCAVCRMPITRPRCSGGNHPTTSRPLAELLLAAAMPPSRRNAPTATSECTNAAANAAAAVSAEPSASTKRSPARSTM